MTRAQVVVALLSFAACQQWDKLEGNALACLTGCGQGGGATGGGAGGGGAMGGHTDAGAVCDLLDAGRACSFTQSAPEGSIAWTRTFSAGDAGSAQIAIATNGCFIYVLTALEHQGRLSVLALDGSDACDISSSFVALSDAGVDLSASGVTLAGLWNAGGQASVHVFDRKAGGAQPQTFGLPFESGLVSVSDNDGGILAVGTSTSELKTWRIAGATASAGPSWSCDQARLGSVAPMDGGLFLVAGVHSGGVACSLNGYDVSYGSGFLLPIDSMALPTGTASNTRAVFASGGLYLSRNAMDDPHYGELTFYDLGPPFPGSPHQSAAWNSIDGGGFVTPVDVAGDPILPTAWLVLATDTEVRFTTAPGPYSVPGTGALVVKLTNTHGSGTIARVTPIGGSGERPVRALLLGNQLLVAGTCGGATSALCPTPYGAWLVSVSP